MIFLYLIRRDRKSVKVITILYDKKTYKPCRLNVESLGLSKHITEAINKEIYENRMLWEPWIESADTLQDFINSLINIDLYELRNQM